MHYHCISHYFIPIDHCDCAPHTHSLLMQSACNYNQIKRHCFIVIAGWLLVVTNTHTCTCWCCHKFAIYHYAIVIGNIIYNVSALLWFFVFLLTLIACIIKIWWCWWAMSRGLDGINLRAERAQLLGGPTIRYDVLTAYVCKYLPTPTYNLSLAMSKK